MNHKRDTFKKIAGITTVASLASASWTKPIISSVVLPAHAQSSADEMPQFTREFYDTDITITDDTDAVQFILDLKTITLNSSNNNYEYSFTDASLACGLIDPTSYDGVFRVSGSILEAIGLKSANPEIGPEPSSCRISEPTRTSLAVRVSDGNTSDVAVINIILKI